MKKSLFYIVFCFFFILQKPLFAIDSGSLISQKLINFTSDSSRQFQEYSEINCSEMYELIKESDCASPVFKFLEGGTIRGGIGLHFPGITIDKDEKEIAYLSGKFTPSPIFTVSLPRKMFNQKFVKSINLGYETGLVWNTAFAFEQDIANSKEIKTFDLRTYAMMQYIAVSPTLFMSIGENDNTPKFWTAFGMGLGVGWAWLQGHVIETGGESCKQEVENVMEGGDSKQLRNCPLTSFERSSLGASLRLFWETRWEYILMGAEISSLYVYSESLSLNPVDLNFTLLYIKEI
jgi:hypothetical protein